MSTAREIMHMGAQCVDENETLAQAARMMRDQQIGSLPICGSDNRLKGIITDRDIVVKCLAEGGDPNTMTAREMAQGTPIWVEESAEMREVLQLMQDNKIRRLPVMNSEHRLVGMISEADLAAHLNDKQISQFVSAIYTAPPNS